MEVDDDTPSSFVPAVSMVENDASQTESSSKEDNNNSSMIKVRAMIQACSEGNRSVVAMFLQQTGPSNTSYNHSNGSGSTASRNDDYGGGGDMNEEEARFYFASQQDIETGQSPLMAAAYGGHFEICQLLLDHGAPWNAIDRNNRCAGNYAVIAQQWSIVNLLVDWGTKAELILGAAIRWQRQSNPTLLPPPPPPPPLARDDTTTTPPNTNVSTVMDTSSSSSFSCAAAVGGGDDGDDASVVANKSSMTRPVEHEPCTKPDYLRQKLHFKRSCHHGKTHQNDALLDEDGDAVMMEWERPLMELHAAQLLGPISADDSTTYTSSTGEHLTLPPSSSSSSSSRRRTSVLNVGFGLGLIDTALQQYHPTLHIIIEAHPQVYQRMLDEQWDQKPGVQIEFGKWQDVLPRLMQQHDSSFQVDAIFFDTYGEHFLDLEDFHNLLPQILTRPHGMYSFFNGLAPDNIFFHGVACNCVKLQLEQLGLHAEFWNCDMQGVIHPSVWEGIRRKYWYDERDTYYLPVVTWDNTSTLDGGVVTLSKADDILSTEETIIKPSDHGDNWLSRKNKASSSLETMINDECSGETMIVDPSTGSQFNSNNKRLKM